MELKFSTVLHRGRVGWNIPFRHFKWSRNYRGTILIRMITTKKKVGNHHFIIGQIEIADCVSRAVWCNLVVEKSIWKSHSRLIKHIKKRCWSEWGCRINRADINDGRIKSGRVYRGVGDGRGILLDGCPDIVESAVTLPFELLQWINSRLLLNDEKNNGKRTGKAKPNTPTTTTISISVKLFVFILNFKFLISNYSQIENTDCKGIERISSPSFHSVDMLAEIWFTNPFTTVAENVAILRYWLSRVNSQLLVPLAGHAPMGDELKQKAGCGAWLWNLFGKTIDRSHIYWATPVCFLFGT